jgi:hypothetical protein
MQKINLNSSVHLIVYNKISEIDEFFWNQYVGNIFYQSHQFLKLIEATQSQILFKYAIIEENQQIIGLIYFQQIDFALKNLIQYNPEKKDNFLKTKIKNYFRKKEVKLLNLGNVFFTGDTGIISPDKEKILAYLPDIFRLTDKTFDKKSFGWLTSNLAIGDEKACGNFPKYGFHTLHTEPDLFLNLRPNWQTYNDYLGSFSSKYRVRAKKVMESSADMERRIITADRIQLYKSDMEQLFQNVMQRTHFSVATLNSNFFEANLYALPDICHIYGYFLENKLAGFSTLYMCNKIIHVHYIGLDYTINAIYKLYNRMLLDVVKIGIDSRAERIHFGRTATEIKTTIGAEPSYLNGYLKINNKIWNKIAAYFIKKILPPEFVIRKPFR